MGAMKLPNRARMLSRRVGDHLEVGAEALEDHTTTLIAAMMVPARVRKSRTRCHTWSQMFLAVGIR